jgi:hypothetical protein
MTKLEFMMLTHYRARIGPMTSKEALTIALDAEQFKRDVGPYDITAKYFMQQELDFIEYANLLEKEEILKKENADADRAGLS